MDKKIDSQPFDDWKTLIMSQDAMGNGNDYISSPSTTMPLVLLWYIRRIFIW